jgi:hypothetical protein
VSERRPVHSWADIIKDGKRNVSIGGDIPDIAVVVTADTRDSFGMGSGARTTSLPPIHEANENDA